MALKAGYKGIKKCGPGLKYDNVNGILSLEGESSLKLDNLEDVDITTPLQGDVLMYDGEEWVNEQPDSDPTEDSANLVTSGGVYDALQDRVDWSSYAVTGVHNLFTYPYLISSGTIGTNVAYSVKNNGKINLNGTASANDDINIHYRSGITTDPNPMVLPKGNYILSCPQKVRIDLIKTVNGSSSTIAYVGSTETKKAFTLDEEAQLGAKMTIIGDTTYNNVDVEIMIYSAEDTYEGFAPYAMTNRELTEKPPKLVQSANLQANTNTAFNGVKAHIYQVVCAHPYEQTDSMYLVTLFDAAGTVTAIKDNAAITVSQSNNVITVASTKSTWVKIIDLGSYN